MWWLNKHDQFLLSTAERGQITKVVRCEGCGRSYAYELKRTGHGAAQGHSEAIRRAWENLQRALTIGVEVIPCPACGWYQSNMIPKARRLHHRWMGYVGSCLTLGLILPAFFGLVINHFPVDKGDEPYIPLPILVATLVCLFAVGIGMGARWMYLAARYDPNDEDVEARKLYGQSRATLLSEQEAKDLEARLRHDRKWPDA